VDFKEKW
jgi:hypothetical protein